jgi:type IV pilus assembly protein PilM
MFGSRSRGRMAFNVLKAMGLERPLLGVDVGSTAIKVVYLGFGRRGPVLHYAGLTELLRADKKTKDRGVAMALNEISREGRLKRRKMAVSYSGAGLTVRYLTLPKMPKDEIKEAIRWEAKKQVPHLDEDSVVDYLIVGESEERELKRFEIILVVAGKESIFGQLDELGGYRSQVVAMDVNPLALVNVVKLNFPEDIEGNLVFVDIGASKTDISIAKKGVLRFYRRVQVGGDSITAAVSQSQNIEFEDAEQLKHDTGLKAEDQQKADPGLTDVIRKEVDRIILEIQRSIDYYRAQFREGGIRKVILMGGTPLMHGFPAYLSSYFDSPVVVDNPFARITMKNGGSLELRQMAPRFSTSAGLALRGRGG